MSDSERQQLLSVIAAQVATIEQLTAMVDKLRAEHSEQGKLHEEQLRELNEKLEAALKQLYGKKSERKKPNKMPPPPRGQRSTPEQAAQRRADNQAQVEAQAVDAGEVEHPVTQEQQVCGHCGDQADFRPVGDGKASDHYEYVHGFFRRSRHVVHRMACGCGKTIVSANGPVRCTPGSKYGPGLAAWVIGQKCIMSVPVHRLAKMLKGHGIPISRSTLNGLLIRVALGLEPIVEQLFEQVRVAKIVQADETPIKLMSHDKKAYVWVFIGDGKVVFRFADSRSSETPKSVLGGTTGTLLIDAYAGYKPVMGPEGRLEAGCLAHIRRKFFEALSTAPEAQQALDYISEVYEVEAEARAAGIEGTDAHLILRQMRAGPAMGKLKKWMMHIAKDTPPKSALGRAIAHARKRWKPATRFLYDPKLEVDNNISERTLRIVAIGRKNFGGVGSKEGGRALAILYSLVASCEAQGINPFAYLHDVIERIQSTDPALLTPEAWAASQV